jgi:hypothetical protein
MLFRRQLQEHSMTYVASPVGDGIKHSLIGEFVDWETIVPSLHRRADISGLFLLGRGLLDPAEMPRLVRLQGRIAPFRDFFSSYGGIPIASDRLRRLLEAMDPGVHQFIPIDVMWSADGQIHPRYILNVHVQKDSVIDEKSNVRINAADRNNMSIRMGHLDDQLTLDRSKLTDVNIWRERRYGGHYFLSDALCDAFKRENITFLELRHVLEV